jgi:hypothetical protein
MVRAAKAGLSLAVLLTAAGVSCTSHHHHHLAIVPRTTTTTRTDAPTTAGATTTTTLPLCASPPPLDLGLDAYRHLRNLSYLDLVSRATSQTTADPTGQNADSLNVARSLPGGGKVLLDQAGPGVITFLRMQEARGAPWQLTVDNILPLSIAAADLLAPLSLNPDESHGSSLIMAPVPFKRSAVFASSSANGNFYSLLRRLPYGTPLPPTAANELAADLQRGPSAFLPANLATTHGTSTVKANRDNTVTDLRSTDPARQIRLLHFRVPTNEAPAFGNSTLKIWWDGEASPSVVAPVKFLAGDGAGVYRPANRPLVAGLLAQVNSTTPNTFDFDLSWPMPYQHEARIAIAPPPNQPDLPNVTWSVQTEPFEAPSNWWARLHATYTSIGQPAPGQDMTFLDVGGSGRIVGTVINFGKVGGTLEGNARIYLDDATTPQVQSTGTEEWGLGGDYWHGGQQVTLPLGGLPSADNNPPGAEVDGAALYRFLVADSIPFNRRARVTWEHGALDASQEPYRAAVIWYGTPTPTALLSDSVDFSNPAETSSHHFVGAEQTTQVTGGYAYQDQATAVTKTVEASLGNTSLDMAVTPGATGAFLRRTYDAASANQKADVFVEAQAAGTWYESGAITAVDRAGVVRHFVDDEFPLPPSLIKGRHTIRIELRDRRIPGMASGPWTAAQYQLYSVVPRPCP